ncbi:RNA polymerase subunit RPABC4/transcription elongation factor Spt4 [Anaerosolibacter carboniphilus]|uniref:RNA polymerase subunit RPABC4/transcription elongation factor Spt4 n=1 Tax=Anaerosolibacter carboniphilus TaxID=1417629 RepID=A0A841KSF9_9FIRM|nr:zinc ribbon domain-containing protein [Anaerosolibacter carboniphilus]MBB6214980.1 RNA polymerase subunit RPABC4/transcription elongation factor Spt4 [Anaerosolibacter carboniphilus]
MWEAIKNDPVLKSITILVLGVLSFGLAFNIMFGRNTGGMEGGMDMGGGYSLVNTLSYILAISVKLLFIGLVIAAIILLIMLVKRYLIERNELKMFESNKFEEIKKDPVLKTGLIAVGTVLVLGLMIIIFNAVFSPYNGYGAMGRNYYGMMTNGYISPMGNTALIIAKLLLSVSVIGLIVSFVAYARQGNISVDVKKLIPVKSSSNTTVKCEVCNFAADQEYKFCPSCGKQRIQECAHCKTVLKDAWKCCPNCGTEVNTTESEISAATIEKVDENTEESSSLIEMIEAKDVASDISDKTETSVLAESNSKHQEIDEKKQKKQK